MKSNVYILIISLILLVSIGLNVYLFKSLDTVQKQFDEQSEIIKKYDEIDKRLKKGDRNLLTMLEKFLDNKAYIVNGKTVSTGDYLIYNNKIQDSLENYKWIVDKATRDYGINIIVTYNRDSTTRTIQKIGTSRADSAQMIYEFYKDKLNFKKGNWHIGGDYKEEYFQLLKQLENQQKVSEGVKKTIDSIKKELQK